MLRDVNRAVQVFGRHMVDCTVLILFQMSVLADNGLNPVWWVKFDVDVINPPLAYLRFVVNDEDMFGEPNFIGHAIFPMCSLKTGMYFHFYIHFCITEYESVGTTVS